MSDCSLYRCETSTDNVGHLDLALRRTNAKCSHVCTAIVMYCVRSPSEFVVTLLRLVRSLSHNLDVGTTLQIGCPERLS